MFKMMLEMNGFELYKKMQNIDKKLKVCFITAFEDYSEEFKQSFPELDETKCFARKPTYKMSNNYLGFKACGSKRYAITHILLKMNF